MNRNAATAVVIAGAAMVLGGLLMLSHLAGQESGREALARLQLVWPDYMDLPEMDRAVIAGLAFQCGMDRAEPRADAVVACLQEAAASEDPSFPKGVTPEAGRQSLAKLLLRSDRALVRGAIIASLATTYGVEPGDIAVGEITVNGERWLAQGAVAGRTCEVGLIRHGTANEYGWVVEQLECTKQVDTGSQHAD